MAECAGAFPPYDPRAATELIWTLWKDGGAERVEIVDYHQE